MSTNPAAVAKANPNFVPFFLDTYRDPKEHLLGHEEWWRDYQVFLESRGYMLRTRLRPGWKPSWLATGKYPWRVEDAVYSPVRLKLMDATRISDGKLVYIKQVQTGDQESTIACYFNSEELHDPSISFMVMPFLRDIHNPPFEYVGEVLEFGEQVLKGLTFMHEQGVAHRNCARFNIMIDAPDMYPRGYHPVSHWLLPDLSGDAPYKPRLTVDVEYYFVDYGLSTQFPPGMMTGLVLGTWAQDHDVPELSDEVPYDAFKVDIFTVGNAFRHVFLDNFVNADFIRPLATSMTNADPAARPTAAQGFAEWRSVCASFTNLGRYRRLKTQHDAEESYAEQALSGVYHALRTGSNLFLPDAVSSPLFKIHSMFTP